MEDFLWHLIGFGFVIFVAIGFLSFFLGELKIIFDPNDKLSNGFYHWIKKISKKDNKDDEDGETIHSSFTIHFHADKDFPDGEP